MTPSTNPARDEAVQPITPERLAEVKERFNAIPHADPDSLTGHVKGMLALIDSLSAAPAPASGGVDAVYEACAAVARGDVRPQADGFWTDYAVGRLDAEKDIRTLASLSPAATSGSEAGGEQWSADQIATIWTAAMTAACNIVIHRQNDLNDDDGPVDVLNEQGQIIHQIKKWLKPDAVYLEELRAMLGAKSSSPMRDAAKNALDYLTVLYNAGDIDGQVGGEIMSELSAALGSGE